MRARRLGVAILTLVSLLATMLPLAATPVAAAGAGAQLAPQVSAADGGQAGLGVGVSGDTIGVGTVVTGYQFTLTPSSASAVQFGTVFCPTGFPGCSGHVDATTGALTVDVTGAPGAAAPAELAFVPVRVVAPVTQLATVTLSFAQLMTANGPATALPAPASVVLQRGAVENAGSGPPAAPRVPSQDDVNAALQYLVGTLPAGTGQGQVNPVNMASLVPDGSSGADVPGPANAVALLQYLAGQRGPDLGPATVAVTAAASNPTTAGFRLTLSPAVPGLTVGDLSLSGAHVESLTTADGGATYAVLASLAQGQSYTLAIVIAGYTFGAPLTVTVPQALATAVDASVSGVSPAGFTLSLSPPVPGLVAGDLGLAEAQSMTTVDGGATYAVAASLAPGQSYTLAIVVAGYTFGAPLTVTVPQTVATAVYASVYGPSASGFTLTLSPPVDGLVPGDLSLSGGASVNSLSTSSHGASYDVGAALVAGANYTLTISAAGYSFGAPLAVGVPGPTVATAVYASVYGVSTGGFLLGLSPSVPGLTVALAGATVVSAVPSDGGAMYTVSGSLMPGQTYALTLSAPGYTFVAPATVTVPVQTVVASVSGVSAGGFTLSLRPPVAGLAADDLTLSGGASVTRLGTSDDGASYSVDATFPSPGTPYMLNITASGYTFSSPTVYVPVEAATATVSGISTGGFTLALNPAVAGLSAADLALSDGASVSSASTSNNGMTYTVDATFPAPGTTYTLTVNDNGYTFTQPPVPVPTETATASVSGVSTAGFTVNLSQAVPGLQVGLAGVTGVSATAAPGDTSYAVAVSGPLTPGQTYAVTLTATGYAIAGLTSISVPVTATVTQVTTSQFTVSLNAAVSGMTVTLAGATVQSSTPSPDDTVYTVKVQGSLIGGQSYPLTLGATGYTFTGATSVDVPLTTVSASVYTTSTGFTLTLGQAVPDLTVKLDGTAVPASTQNDITYTVSATLNPGETYPLSLEAAGYTFGGATSVTGLVTVAGAVYSASESGFTLTLGETLLGFGQGSLTLTAGDQTIPVGTPLSVGNGSYLVPATLTAGTTYTLTLTQNPYVLAAPLTFRVNFASTSYDATLVELDFGTPMAAPDPTGAGFTVTADGAADTVIAAVYSPDLTKVALFLTTPVPVGTVTVSYAPGTLQTQAGVAWPAFTEATVPTAGSVAVALAGQSGTDTSVFQSLVSAGYAASAIAQAMVAAFPSESAARLASLLSSNSHWVPQVAAASLLAANFPAGDVAAALVSVYHADATTVGAALQPTVTSAAALVSLLQGVGFTDEASLAEELYTAQFTVQQATDEMAAVFPNEGFGPALVAAGYGLTDILTETQRVVGYYGPSYTFPVQLPFTDSQPSVDTAATYFQSQSQPEATAAFWLWSIYYAAQAASPLADALAAAGYPIDSITRELANRFPNDVTTLTDALKSAGFTADDIVASIHRVSGLNAAAMTTVLALTGTSQPVAILQAMQQAGMGLYDVAAGALSLAPGNASVASEYLEQAGYTAAQVTTVMEPTLQGEGDWNAGGVAAMLASYSCTPTCEGNFSATDIAAVLQSNFDATPAAVAATLLGEGSNAGHWSYSLSDVASALKTQYGVDGTAFAQIALGYYGSGRGIQSQLTANGDLMSLLQTTFGLNAEQVIGALHGILTADGDNDLPTVLQDILSTDAPTATTAAEKAQETYTLLGQAGYSLDDIGYALQSSAAGLTLAQTLPDLRGFGYTIDSVAMYLYGFYNAGLTSLDSTANDLAVAGYGSCSSEPSTLAPIITALEQVYGVTGTYLVSTTGAQQIMNLPGSTFGTTCTDGDVAAAVNAVSPVSQLPLTVVQVQQSAGRPAADAIALLRQVFGESDPVVIAETLQQAGYGTSDVLVALGAAFTLTAAQADRIAAGLAVNTATLPVGTVGQAYAGTLVGNGGTGALSWAVVAGSLPTGLGLNTVTGQVYGTPTAAGMSNFTVQATDAGSGETADAFMGITVGSSVQGLSVATTALPDAFAGQPYAAALATGGGSPAYRWRLSAGSLPAGLSLVQATGEITGTPSATGTSGFTVTVTDGAGATASAQIVLTVDNRAVTTIEEMLPAQYSILDVAPLLGVSAPLTLGADFTAVGTIPVFDTLLQLFEPGGAMADPAALAADLNALGLSEADAALTLNTLGYTSPAQIGSLLWSNGYALGDLSQGVYNALSASAVASGWVTPMFAALVQMTTCSAALGLNVLPACQSGTSTFTLSDATGALLDALAGNPSAACSNNPVLCILVWQAMRSAGISVADTVNALVAAPFSMPWDQVGDNLQHQEGYTAAQIASFASSINETVAELAQSLYGTTYSYSQVGDALVTVTDTETASYAMKYAGYSALAIGYFYLSLGASTVDMSEDLMYIGFSWSTAKDVSMQLHPINVRQYMAFVGRVTPLGLFVGNPASGWSGTGIDGVLGSFASGGGGALLSFGLGHLATANAT